MNKTFEFDHPLNDGLVPCGFLHIEGKITATGLPVIKKVTWMHDQTGSISSWVPLKLLAAMPSKELVGNTMISDLYSAAKNHIAPPDLGEAHRVQCTDKLP